MYKSQGNALGSNEKEHPSPERATYKPFQGICLTDTFQLYEHEDLISDRLKDNSDRRVRQKNLDIRVIMGNPPYSAGQTSANDNNQNVAYPDLDQSIRTTYAEHSTATNKNALYDSYIRAIRWASDRIGESGIIGYVSGSAWIERSFADGMRKCLAEEFTDIYIFNLRGDIRKNMLSKGAAKEGGNIFDSGSMTGIAISFFVKNPQSKTQGNIYVHGIGDDLKAAEKRKIIKEFQSINGITSNKGWDEVTPDKYNDWLNQRDESFEKYISISPQNEISIFNIRSRGLETSRDSWCYNFSFDELNQNVKSSIDFYNQNLESNDPIIDLKSISWTRGLKKSHGTQKIIHHQKDRSYLALYRPYIKQYAYFDRDFNEYVNQLPKFFPETSFGNLVICVNGVGARSGFSTLITKTLPNLHTLDTGQCFPLYLYEESTDTDDELFTSENENGYTRRDGISDPGLAHFQTAYSKSGEGSTLSKEDLFYYIYGLLHSPEYRSRYKDNLSKELPRIPAVKKFTDFMAYSKAGRDLAHWHLNYETVETCKAVKLDYGKNDLKALSDDDYRVIKMKFAKMKDPETGKSVNDKTTIIYNPQITLHNIPLDAYDYVVNGKPAIEWVMERQSVTTDKKSNITNDANLYATETMQNPKYPLELLLRVITVSQETNQIVANLPELEID